MISALRMTARQTLQARRMSTNTYENILVEMRPEQRVALITLNRPKALNALCNALIMELNAEMKLLDADPTVGAIVITGSKWGAF